MTDGLPKKFPMIELIRQGVYKEENMTKGSYYAFKKLYFRNI